MFDGWYNRNKLDYNKLIKQCTKIINNTNINQQRRYSLHQSANIPKHKDYNIPIHRQKPNNINNYNIFNNILSNSYKRKYKLNLKYKIHKYNSINNNKIRHSGNKMEINNNIKINNKFVKHKKISKHIICLLGYKQNTGP